MFRKIKKIFRNSTTSNLSFKKAHNITKSKTIYVGNLNFNIREEIIWDFFTRCGEIRRIITGINRIDLSQCGFCFIEFSNIKTPIICFINKNGLTLNKRRLRIDLDQGFIEGRQFGRGRKGGQLLEDLENLKRKQKFLKNQF